MAQMLDFRERSRFRRAVYAKPTIMLLLVAVFFVGYRAWGMYEKSVTAREKRDTARAELQKLQTYEAQLNKDIAGLSTPRGQENEIRDRFMVAREGEKIIVVTDPDRDKVHTVTVTSPETPPSIVDKLKASLGELGQ